MSNRFGLSDIYIDARNVYLRTASTKIGTSSCSQSDEYKAHDKLQVLLGKPAGSTQDPYFFINSYHTRAVANGILGVNRQNKCPIPPTR